MSYVICLPKAQHRHTMHKRNVVWYQKIAVLKYSTNMNDYQLRESLGNLLKKLLVKERVSKGEPMLDKLIGFLFVLGLCLLVWVIFIYRRTIIELEIPLLLWLTPGIILTPFFYTRLNNIDGMKAHWILHYILHSCMTGAVILFSFMSINYYLADDVITTKQYEVLDIGSLPGGKNDREKRKPYVIINYKGLDKQLIFSNSQMENVRNAKIVIVDVRKGKLGFDILENYILK